MSPVRVACPGEISGVEEDADVRRIKQEKRDRRPWTAGADNPAFDGKDNLRGVTDISSSLLHEGINKTSKPAGPSRCRAPHGVRTGTSSGSPAVPRRPPGPFFTPDGKALFLAVEHPGGEAENIDEPTGFWPEGTSLAAPLSPASSRGRSRIGRSRPPLDGGTALPPSPGEA